MRPLEGLMGGLTSVLCTGGRRCIALGNMEAWSGPSGWCMRRTHCRSKWLEPWRRGETPRVYSRFLMSTTDCFFASCDGGGDNGWIRRWAG